MDLENLLDAEDFDKLLDDKRHKEILNALKDDSEDDEDFQKLLNDKRHKEILNVLKEILLSLSKKDEPNSYDFTKIENILKELANNKNEDDLPKSILNLGKIIENKLNEIKLESSNYNWEFIIHRDHKNFIVKVDAIKVIIK